MMLNKRICGSMTERSSVRLPKAAVTRLRRFNGAAAHRLQLSYYDKADLALIIFAVSPERMELKYLFAYGQAHADARTATLTGFVALSEFTPGLLGRLHTFPLGRIDNL